MMLSSWKLFCLCLAVVLLDTGAVGQSCGQRNADGIGFRSADTSGNAAYGEFPWTVAIYTGAIMYGQVFYSLQCSGSLIHPSVVLTVAHSVQDIVADRIRVRLGEYDINTNDELYSTQNRSVVEIVTHAEYKKTTMHNDVALLFLDKPAELMESVGTVCLPPADTNFDLSRCFSSGWDTRVRASSTSVPKKIELPVVPQDKCQKTLRSTRLGPLYVLHASFLCAGGEKDVEKCAGGGGSPLVCPIAGSDNRYYQAGMVAWGISCDRDGIPEVYVNVAMFRGWIDKQLRQRNMGDHYYQYSEVNDNRP